jgi:hypothetical protein
MSFKLEYISEVEAKGQTDRIDNREVQKLLQRSEYNSKNETCHANVKEQNTKSNPDRQQASVKYIRMRVYRNTGCWYLPFISV